MFFSPFSIAITSLGEERANLSPFRTFVRFVLVLICRFPLPLGVWEVLRFMIVALPRLFSYLFFFFFFFFYISFIIFFFFYFIFFFFFVSCLSFCFVLFFERAAIAPSRVMILHLNMLITEDVREDFNT